METKTEQEAQRRVYVACLASYNNGVLHGAWIDAEQPAEDIHQEVDSMLRASRFPNVQVHCLTCGGQSEHGNDKAAYADCENCRGTGLVPSAEEWAIHDYEGFDGIKLNECDSFERVALLAELLEEHGEGFAVWYDNETRDDDDSLASDFQDAYAGEWDSVQAYAEDYIEQTGELKDGSTLARYFDYESFARDLEHGGDIWSARGPSGSLYVFHSC